MTCRHSGTDAEIRRGIHRPRQARGKAWVLALSLVAAASMAAQQAGGPASPPTRDDLPALPAPGGGNSTTEKLTGCGKVEPFLSAGVFPQAKVLLITTPTGFLKQYSYPEFRLQGSFKFASGPAYHAILDGKKSRLYAVMAGKQGGAPELHLFDVKEILEGEAESGAELRPARKLSLAANIRQLLMTPDGRKLFCLSASEQSSTSDARGSIPSGVKLSRVDAASMEVDAEAKLSDGTGSCCMAPDGKAIYVAGSTKPHSADNFGPFDGFVQLVDPATLQPRQRIDIDGDPFSLAATNDGLLFISGGSGDWTQITIVDTGKATAVIARWTGIQMGSFVNVTPDGRRLCVSGPSGIDIFEIPTAVAGSRARKVARFNDPGESGKSVPLCITPDSAFIISCGGEILQLSTLRAKGTNDQRAPPKPGAPPCGVDGSIVVKPPGT